MTVEVCANSFESAINAKEGNADRIELCMELGVGGVTPSYGLIKEVKKALNIPVYVLIRPRSGHFVYSEAEKRIMLEDIARFAALGCEGIVSGALDRNGYIDIPFTAELLRVSGEMDFTFHRAIDWTPDLREAAEVLADLGCKRILSSGAKRSAIEGLSVLQELQQQSGGNLSVMPGGGINAGNISSFVNAGFDEIHFSASSTVRAEVSLPPFSFGGNDNFKELEITTSNTSLINRMVALVKD